MCVSISLARGRKEIEDYFDIDFSVTHYDPFYYASAFTFPSLPVILQGEDPQVASLKWGLVPPWVKDRESADAMRSRMVNARSETLTQKPSYRGSVQRQRCIILADGYFEPHHRGKEVIPFYIKRKDDKPFGIAGLFSQWQDPDSGVSQRTFTLITKPADRLLSEVHNDKMRMPALLPPREERRWIDSTAGFEEVKGLLAAQEHSDYIAWPVSRALYRRHEKPFGREILERVEPDESPGAGSAQGGDQPELPF